MSYKGIQINSFKGRSFIGEHYIVLNVTPAFNFHAGQEAVNVMTITGESLFELLEDNGKAEEWFKHFAN